MQYAQLKSLAYGNQTAIFIGNEATYFTKEVPSAKEFRLPHGRPPDRFYQTRIIGDGSQRDVATQIEVVEDPLELS
jgi:hypothetical protein